MLRMPMIQPANDAPMIVAPGSTAWLIASERNGPFSPIAISWKS